MRSSTAVAVSPDGTTFASADERARPAPVAADHLARRAGARARDLPADRHRPRRRRAQPLRRGHRIRRDVRSMTRRPTAVRAVMTIDHRGIRMSYARTCRAMTLDRDRRRGGRWRRPPRRPTRPSRVWKCRASAGYTLAQRRARAETIVANGKVPAAARIPTSAVCGSERGRAAATCRAARGSRRACSSAPSASAITSIEPESAAPTTSASARARAIDNLDARLPGGRRGRRSARPPPSSSATGRCDGRDAAADRHEPRHRADARRRADRRRRARAGARRRCCPCSRRRSPRRPTSGSARRGLADRPRAAHRRSAAAPTRSSTRSSRSPRSASRAASARTCSCRPASARTARCTASAAPCA